MLDALGAWAFKAVSIALKLGVFEALSGSPLMAEETARQIKADERGISLLLETLGTLGYVRKQDGRYANTAMTVKWSRLGSDCRASSAYNQRLSLHISTAFGSLSTPHMHSVSSSCLSFRVREPPFRFSSSSRSHR